MQGWTATTRHAVTRKKAQKRLQDTENLFRKNCFQSFETFARTTHEAIVREITNSTAVNIYFNSKRKICTDSVVWKHLRKDKGKEFLLRFIVFIFYFRHML